MTYAGELTNAMTWLGEKPDTLFIGQTVVYGGSFTAEALVGVPKSRRIELPVAEEMQMGMSIGLAMKGNTVISIYPRMDFLLLAMNQLVNHLDKNLYPLQGNVIIRTVVGRTKPLHPGIQHCGDYSEGLEKMLERVGLIRLIHPLNIMPAYMGAYASRWPTVLVEYGDKYEEEA